MRDKSTGWAYVWLCTLGLFGAHQYYMGKVGRGLLYTFTIAGLGALWVLDVFTLASQVRTVNAWRRGYLGGSVVVNNVQAQTNTHRAE